MGHPRVLFPSAVVGDTNAGKDGGCINANSYPGRKWSIRGKGRIPNRVGISFEYNPYDFTLGMNDWFLLYSFPAFGILSPAYCRKLISS